MLFALRMQIILLKKVVLLLGAIDNNLAHLVVLDMQDMQAIVIHSHAQRWIWSFIHLPTPCSCEP